MVQANTGDQAKNQILRWPSILIIAAFAIDLLTPLLIWKGFLPGGLRWLSHAAVAAMILFIPMRMLVFNKIPKVFWFVVVFSTVSILTAILTGQGIPATIWGWWLMFQFPLVGLFSYLQPGWLRGFSSKLLIVMIAAAGLEVVVQIGQYLLGEVPGDNLAGTFGQNGTGDLVLFLILGLCFMLGHWLMTQEWIKLVIMLGLGIASSILGEMKLFYLATAILGLLGVLVYLIRGKNIWKLAPITIILAGSILAFIPLYNTFVPSAKELPLEGYFKNPALLTKYLTFVNKSTSGANYYYDIGRNYAVVYGWNKINNSIQDLYIGYGIGSRSESKSLGIVGRGLEDGELGITSGTSILVFIQETGLFGILGLTGFFLVVIFGLIAQVRSQPQSDSNCIRIGLIYFSLLWPVWLWYNAAWMLRVPMIIYWSSLGYVFSDFEYTKAYLHADQKMFPNNIAPSLRIKERKNENILFDHSA